MPAEMTGMELAALGLMVENGQIVKAREELDKLGAAGEQAAAKTTMAWRGATKELDLFTLAARRNPFQAGGFATGFRAQQEIMQAMVRDQQALAPASLNAARALNTVRAGMTALAFQTAGLPGTLGRVTTGLLSFGAGSTTILAVVAGLGLVALAYQALTKAANEARRATEELIAAQLKQRQQERSEDIRGRETLAALSAEVELRKRAFEDAQALVDAAKRAARAGREADLSGAIRREEQAQLALNDALMAHNRQLRELRGIETGAEREARLKDEAKALVDLVAKREAMVVAAEHELELFGKSVEEAARLQGIWAGLNAQQQKRLEVATAELHQRQIMAELDQRFFAARDRVVRDFFNPGVTAPSIPTGLSPEDIERITADLDRVRREMTAMGLDVVDIWKGVAQEIEAALRDSFTHVFVDGGIRFRQLADEIVRIFGQAATKLISDELFGSMADGLKKSLATAGVGLGIGVVVAGVTELIGGLFGLGDAARAARERIRELNNSLDAFRASVTPENLDDQILQVRLQTEELRRQARAAHPHDLELILMELGGLETRRIEQLKAEAAALKQARDEDLVVRLMRARGRDQEADDMAFALAQQRELAEARRAEADANYILMLQFVQAAEAQKRAADKIRETITGLTATIDLLRGFTASLRLNASLTALSPVQQLAEARRQYETVLAAARGGDQAAAGRLPDVARSFLEASRAVNASGGRYQVDFFRVLRETEELAKMFEDQRSAQQQQLDALTKISIELGDVDQTLQPIVVATEATAEAAQAIAEGQVRTLAVLVEGFKALTEDNASLRGDVRRLRQELEGAKV